jgi:penicillin-binding protein 1A
MTLRQGLMYSKNSITAQVMQGVGPAHVAKLARAMGVRQSKLDEVLSLALGTSPVTLKEMVSSYSTLVNDGRYIEPLLVTQVEDRNGKVLEAFQVHAAETVIETAVAQTLVDVMRGVIDQGTGSGIRSRYGIRADVAGKTGTTQDNTDGWFILMQSQVVAGAWVGFNDNRVTMGSRWGQGAQSALPIVGEFFRQAIRARVVDQALRFAAPRGASAVELVQLDASGQPLPEPDPSAEKMAQNPLAPGAAALPEGSWQPAPGLRYITVPGPAADAPKAEFEAPGILVPRDLPPPDRR